LTELVLRELAFYFAHYGEAEKAWVEQLRDEVIDADALRLFNEEIVLAFDLRPDLGRITAPTLVITGAEDFITGAVCAGDFVAGIPGSELAILPSCGHIIFVEQPTAFRDAVVGFLDS
jgi:3-oxoadipate enol-lactonase/4-carboxymuconolactone decarboxylase